MWFKSGNMSLDLREILNSNIATGRRGKGCYN